MYGLRRRLIPLDLTDGLRDRLLGKERRRPLLLSERRGEESSGGGGRRATGTETEWFKTKSGMTCHHALPAASAATQFCSRSHVRPQLFSTPSASSFRLTARSRPSSCPNQPSWVPRRRRGPILSSRHPLFPRRLDSCLVAIARSRRIYPLFSHLLPAPPCWPDPARSVRECGYTGGRPIDRPSSSQTYPDVSPWVASSQSTPQRVVYSIAPATLGHDIRASA